MKQIIHMLCLVTIILSAACHTKDDSQRVKAIKENRQFEKPVNRFAGVQFVSEKDTYCGMPLSAGVEDIVVLNGKIFGFCSKESKGEFVTTLQAKHKR